MQELLNKLTSYNIFNHLLPGIVFAVISSKFTTYDLVQSDIITGVFLYYLMGLIISRIGALIIEPLLRKISFIKLVSYNDFIVAAKKDDKIEVISETNNMYRTFSSLFAVLLFLKAYEFAENAIPFIKETRATIAIVLLLALFLASYKKQTNYIAKRVNNDS
ncbi:MAG: hypothetical protein COC24_003565 [Alphaproteobacteria bacterium]|nr:hypothetical protein [Alphaproteobacteria bacterium]